MQGGRHGLIDPFMLCQVIFFFTPSQEIKSNVQLQVTQSSFNVAAISFQKRRKRPRHESDSSIDSESDSDVCIITICV